MYMKCPEGASRKINKQKLHYRKVAQLQKLVRGWEEKIMGSEVSFKSDETVLKMQVMAAQLCEHTENILNCTF